MTASAHSRPPFPGRARPARKTAREHAFPAAIRLLLLALLAALPASAAEHPVTLLRFGDCSPCHTSKTSGRSVHSAMALSCSVCHLARTEGDSTTIQLVEPRERICFACHERSAPPRQHSPAVKGDCMDCHDAHSSSRPMLLRGKAGLRPPPRKAAGRETKPAAQAERLKMASGRHSRTQAKP